MSDLENLLKLTRSLLDEFPIEMCIYICTFTRPFGKSSLTGIRGREETGSYKESLVADTGKLNEVTVGESAYM